MTNDDTEELSTAPNGLPLSEQPRWRQDFPIDVPQDNYVSRREFTKFLGLTSVAFTAGQFWIVYKDWQRNRKGPDARKKVANVAQISIGGSIIFNYPNEHEPCLLIRLSETEFVAYSQKCTHLSCAVVPDVQNNQIICPCHHGYFSLAEGRPLEGPPQRPLPNIKLDIQNNEIYAIGVELRT